MEAGMFFPGVNVLEWIGYLASALVLVSLLMSSILKLRWINLAGSIVFSVYGFLIGAFPVGIANFIIAIINIYYLVRIYTTKEYFKIVPIETCSEYFKYFLSFYHDDIKKYFSRETFNLDKEAVGFYIVRNAIPAGVFLATKRDADSLLIELDYVIPRYRDFKTGRYVYEDQKRYFADKGYRSIYGYANNPEHEAYLRKMGFVETREADRKIFVKNVER